MKKKYKNTSIMLLSALCCVGFMCGCSDQNMDVIEESQPVSTEEQAVDTSYVGKIWFEAESDGSQPAGDTPTICFDADGTGELWFEVGDGGAGVVYYKYEIQEDGSIIMEDKEEESQELAQGYKLEDKWKKINVTVSRWEEGNSDILTVQLNDGSTIKYYDEQAEILEDSH